MIGATLITCITRDQLDLSVKLYLAGMTSEAICDDTYTLVEGCERLSGG